MVVFGASCLVEGEAEGALIVWHTALSFWGGFDATRGCVIDRSHPALGEIITGRLLAMPSGRGSSSASSVLAEAIRRGTAPAGLILTLPDPILTVGAIVARKLYGRPCPILVCEAEVFARLATGEGARLISRPEGSSIRLIGPDPEPARAVAMSGTKGAAWTSLPGVNEGDGDGPR